MKTALQAALCLTLFANASVRAQDLANDKIDGGLSGASGQGSSNAADIKYDKSQLFEIARDGYIYGLPLVMNYAVMFSYVVDRASGRYKAPFNTINSANRVFTYQDTTIVTPNSDTPYSMVWLDLRAEPVVLSVPTVENGRYYSIQLCDGNTFNYGYIGSRSTGNEAGDYLVVGPDWNGEIPAGFKKVFRSSTQFSLAVFRTQLFSPLDMPNVMAVQSGYKAQQLSKYLHLTTPPCPPAIEFPAINGDLAKSNFFEYLDFVLQFAPAGPEEQDIRAKLAEIGVGPNKRFLFENLSPQKKRIIALGMQEGQRLVEERVATIGKSVNGWLIGQGCGDRAFYNGDWLHRSAVAKAGIYGNDSAEAVYPLARKDAMGQPLDGGKHNYTITFPAGQLPPVKAFWSVTLYDGNTQLLIKNPIDRYLINSSMLPELKKNSDGSLTIYIQKDSPGADKESNWLPAPDGPIYLVMRLYWPSDGQPSILPPGEGTWKPPLITAS